MPGQQGSGPLALGGAAGQSARFPCHAVGDHHLSRFEVPAFGRFARNRFQSNLSPANCQTGPGLFRFLGDATVTGRQVVRAQTISQRDLGRTTESAVETGGRAINGGGWCGPFVRRTSISCHHSGLRWRARSCARWCRPRFPYAPLSRLAAATLHIRQQSPPGQVFIARAIPSEGDTACIQTGSKSRPQPSPIFPCRPYPEVLVCLKG